MTVLGSYGEERTKKGLEIIVPISSSVWYPLHGLIHLHVFLLQES